ncbi:MAG: hypothetical protein Q9195_008245 [Heterodermia aff. obscurata]
MEKSPSAFQPPNNNIQPAPSSPTGDESVPPVPAKESPPPTAELNSQTSPPTTAQPRPGTPDFFLANSSYSMPGAYPVTPLAIDPRTQSADTSIPHTPERRTPPSGKRRGSTSSVRNLLASLRRPSGNEQPRLSDDSLEADPMKRPATPSQDSMASTGRSLKKKMSGSFWTRRKSSLGVEVMMEGGSQGRPENDRSTTSTPVTSQNGHSTSPQAVRSPTSPKDSEGGSIMSSIRKRRSGIFWGKRNSSLGMDTKPSHGDAGSDKIFQGHARTTSTASGPSSVDQSPTRPLRQKKSASFWKRKPSLDLNRAATSTQHDSTRFASSPTQAIKENTIEDESAASRQSEAGSYAPAQRSDSPPPVLPELKLELGGGMGNGSLTEADDMFANIGKD